MYDLLSTLDVTKANGHDDISATMLKKTAVSITPAITELFNTSVRHASSCVILKAMFVWFIGFHLQDWYLSCMQNEVKTSCSLIVVIWTLKTLIKTGTGHYQKLITVH